MALLPMSTLTARPQVVMAALTLTLTLTPNQVVMAAVSRHLRLPPHAFDLHLAYNTKVHP